MLIFLPLTLPLLLLLVGSFRILVCCCTTVRLRRAKPSEWRLGSNLVTRSAYARFLCDTKSAPKLVADLL